MRLPYMRLRKRTGVIVIARTTQQGGPAPMVPSYAMGCV
jgi:hypothetical protein